MLNSTPAARRYGFQIHAIVFVLTMILLVVIDFATGKPYWFFWPLLGSGIGLFRHWWFVIGPGKPTNPNSTGVAHDQ